MNKSKIKAFSLIEMSIVILIIGILITAATKGSKMINRARLDSARLITTSSGIDHIPNMTFWVETTLEDSLTSVTHQLQPENNDTISGWKDLNPSTLKYNLSQTTAANRPTYIAEAINGLPALQFDGTNDNFITTNLVGRNLSLFIVLKTSSAGIGTTGSYAYEGSSVIYADIAGPTSDIIPLAISAGLVKIGTNTTVLTGATAINDNKPHIIETSRNMSNGTRAIYIDGTSAVTPDTADTGELLANVCMAIGGNTLDARYFNGYIAEIIIFERILKQNERKAVEAYLGKKWSVRVS